MIWNFDEDRRKNGTGSIAGYAFIHCLVEMEKRLGKEDLIAPTKDGNYDIQFIVNGVELDFADTIKEFENQSDRMIKEAAVKLIRQKFPNLANQLEMMEREVIDKMRADLGLPKSEHEW